MIRFEGQLQESEYRKAQWVSSPKIFRWVGWIIMAALVMNLATGGMGPILRHPLMGTVKLALGVAFALFMIIAPRRAVTKVWRNTPLLHERVNGYISEEAVGWKTPSTDSAFGWDKIIKARMRDDLFLLYTSSNQALIIPRSYFGSASEWDAAKALIAKKKLTA